MKYTTLWLISAAEYVVRGGRYSAFLFEVEGTFCTDLNLTDNHIIVRTSHFTISPKTRINHILHIVVAFTWSHYDYEITVFQVWAFWSILLIQALFTKPNMSDSLDPIKHSTAQRMSSEDTHDSVIVLRRNAILQGALFKHTACAITPCIHAMTA